MIQARGAIRGNRGIVYQVPFVRNTVNRLLNICVIFSNFSPEKGEMI